MGWPGEDFSEGGLRGQRMRSKSWNQKREEHTKQRKRCWSGKGMESYFMFKTYRSGCCVSVYDKKPGWKQVHVIATVTHTVDSPDSKRSTEELWPRGVGMPGRVQPGGTLILISICAVKSPRALLTSSELRSHCLGPKGIGSLLDGSPTNGSVWVFFSKTPWNIFRIENQCVWVSSPRADSL